MALPSCFENYIGILGLCDPDIDPPKSGLYVNNLEGITLQVAAKIANSEQNTGVNLINEKIEFAIRHVADDVMTALASRGFTFQSELSSRTLGIHRDKWIAAPTVDSGLKISLYENCPIETVVVKRVKILSKKTQTVDLKIFDGVNTKIIPVDLVKNVVKFVELNYTVPVTGVEITTSGEDMNNSVLDGWASGGGCSSCGGWRSAHSSNLLYKIDGYNGDTGKTSDATYGIIADIVVTCDRWRFLCMLSQRLSMIILYRTGMQIMNERLSSDRVNYLTLNKEQAQMNLDRYTAEYDKKIKQFVFEIPAFLRDYARQTPCIQCNGARMITVLP